MSVAGTLTRPAGRFPNGQIVPEPTSKGLFQRAGQVAFGVWLVLLGWWASESGEDAGEPVGDGGGDRVSVP